MTEQSRPGLWGRDFTLTLLGTFAFFGSFFYLLSVLPDYIDSIGGAKWQVGLIVGGFSVTPLVIRPFVGRWSDRGGRKRLMRIGLVTTAVSLVLMVASGDVLSLFLLRLVQGAGVAMYPTAAGSLVAEVAPLPRRGESLGFFGMASNAAQMVAPAVGVLIANRWGFDAVFLVAAATALAGLLIVQPVAEPPPKRPPDQAEQAEAPALIPRSALFPMSIFVTVTFAFTATAAFLPLLSNDRGLGNVGLYFLAVGAAALVTRPIAGRGSDRFGRVVVVAPGLLLAGASMWLLALAHGPPMMLASGVAFGIGLGAAHTALFALALDRVPPGQRGAATAVFQMAWDFSGVVGGLVLGIVASLVALDTVYWLSGVVLFAGVAALFAGRAGGLTRPPMEPAARAAP